MSEPKKVGRRTFLNYATAIVATGVIVGAATYLATPKGVETVTAPGATTTVTVPGVATTVTAPGATTTVTKTMTTQPGPTTTTPIPVEMIDPYRDYLNIPPGSALLPGGALGATDLPAFTKLDEYTKAPPYTIVVCSHGGGISWTELMKAAYTLKANQYKQLGYIKEFTYYEPFFDVEKQTSQLETVLAMKPDAVVISPASPTALIPIIDKFYDAGIPTVIVNSQYTGKKFSAFIMQDDRLFGKLQALWLVKKLNGKGKIVVLRGAPGEGPDIYRWEYGAKPVLDQYPGIEVLGVAPTGWSYDGGKKATEAFLAAHPTIDGVISIGGEPTAGAVDAFIEVGRPLVPMTGEDSNALVKRYLKYHGKPEYGNFDTCFPTMPVWWAAKGIDAAIDLLQGRSIPRTQVYAAAYIPTEAIQSYVNKYHFDKFPDDLWWNAIWYTGLTYEQLKDMFGVK